MVRKMAGPAIQENPTQHVPPSVSQQVPPVQMVAPQQPFYPLAGGSGYMMPPPPPPPHYPPPNLGDQSGSQSNKTTITMGKFSLLAIASTLVLLGAFTFLGGFLLGMWLESPKPLAYPTVPVVVNTPSAQAAVSSISGQGGSPAAPAPQSEGVNQMIGDAAGNAIGNYQLPVNVPDFLNPLVTAAQNAASQQAANKAQSVADLVYPSSSASSSSSPSSSQMAPLPQNLPQKSAYVSTPLPQQKVIPTPVAYQPVNPEETGNYTIQVGVFAARDNAEKLKDQLLSSNHTAYVTEGKSTEGNPLYYVHTGRYQDYNTASQSISYIMSQQKLPGAVLVKLSQQGKNNP